MSYAHLHRVREDRREADLSLAELAVLEAIRSLDFGSVEVTVHDGRVVQMECTRKTRFQNQTRES
jgi:hypothetical protein